MSKADKSELVDKSEANDYGRPPRAIDWGIFAGFVPFLTLCLDQGTKYLATRFFKVPMNICEINPYPGFDVDIFWVMDLALVCNFGISWGLLQGDSQFKRWGLTLFAFFMCLVLLSLFRSSRDHVMRLSLGLVIGGAIGNAIDRLLFGAVTDFIDFGDIGFHWVFNIADSAITVGVIGLIASSLWQDYQNKDQAA